MSYFASSSSYSNSFLVSVFTISQKSGILVFGIRSPTNDWNPEFKSNLDSLAWGDHLHPYETIVPFVFLMSKRVNTVQVLLACVEVVSAYFKPSGQARETRSRARPLGKRTTEMTAPHVRVLLK